MNLIGLLMSMKNMQNLEFSSINILMRLDNNLYTNSYYYFNSNMMDKYILRY
jgi:hypothetical protein